MWNSWEPEAKLGYVAGFIDGLFQGHCFTTWGMTEQDGEGCYLGATRSFEFYLGKFVKNVHSDQFALALDGFYLDSRNLPIKVKDGVWVVMNSIAGTANEPMIEVCRRLAAEGRD